ncbi:hypothetical protein VNO78_16638 [Psophocarpus tetragonolobus]|uniref:DUF674 family protein n=1 Tax=Psophocarpus tetragonolobus TaxID=3891 RepID=A0AAN9XK91_PSOTE
MAVAATVEQIPLKVLVDEEKNRVVYVEAGKDFVDVLLSFLTLPLGTIARLVGKESNMNKVSVGSLSSLYDSVANVENKHFWTDACKQMLLHPRNSMESHCQSLKLNIDDTEKTHYFICQSLNCAFQHSGGLLTTFKDQTCKCGKLMNKVVHFDSSLIASEGFVPDMATFIITDELKVTPSNFHVSCLPLNHGYENMDALKLIVDLLKCSLLSPTPLTDVLLTKKQHSRKDSPPGTEWNFDFDIGEADANEQSQMMNVKVIVRKSEESVLFALAEEDFVDFLFSFLTLPLGGVEHMFNGDSCLGSIDNLYKSVPDLDNSYLRSPYIKDMLLKTSLACQFKLRNKILPMSYLDPQSSNYEIYSKNGGRRFVGKPSLFMVTDDLVVTPSSSISAISYVAKLGVPSSDLEEIVIKIGQKEGLCLLKACLITSSTNSLNSMITLVRTEEKSPKVMYLTYN